MCKQRRLRVRGTAHTWLAVLPLAQPPPLARLPAPVQRLATSCAALVASTCRHEREHPERGLQGGLGDGGKWVCGVRTLLQQKPCVVYSFGSNGEANFELNLVAATGCALQRAWPVPKRFQSSSPATSRCRGGPVSRSALAVTGHTGPGGSGGGACSARPRRAASLTGAPRRPARRCEMHVFDPTLTPQQTLFMRSLPGITFHEYGIGVSDGEARGPCRVCCAVTRGFAASAPWWHPAHAATWCHSWGGGVRPLLAAAGRRARGAPGPACLLARWLVRSCWLLSACSAAFHTPGFSTPQGGFSRAARAGARGAGPRDHGPAQQGQPGRAAPDERHARAGPRLGGPAQGGRGGRRVGRARRPAGRGAARAAALHADAGAPRGACHQGRSHCRTVEPARCAGPSSAWSCCRQIQCKNLHHK